MTVVITFQCLRYGPSQPKVTVLLRFSWTWPRQAIPGMLVGSALNISMMLVRFYDARGQTQGHARVRQASGVELHL